MFYSTTCHPDTDGSRERINHTIQIALRFFVHGIENPSMWPTALLAIQSIINNNFSLTIGKTPNEIAYSVTSRRSLGLFSSLPSLAIVTTRIEAADAISFAMANQKTHYVWKHQLLFIKKGEWAILRFRKGYSISATFRITKKFTQQYVGPFQIESKVGRLAYKLKISPDCKIHPVFSVAQLELALLPCNDRFFCFYPTHSPTEFVDRATVSVESFEIERLLKKKNNQTRPW